MAQFNFDTNSVEKRENNYDLLPAGWYTAQVTESDVVALKSGNGRGIKLTFTILSDHGRGRKLWTQLNTQHTSEKAERIGQQQLRELCEAIGLARMTDTVELHNKPVQIRVKVRVDDTGQYEPQNEVSGFKPVAGNAAPVVGQAARPSSPAPANAPAAPAAAGAPVPPWQKRAA